MTLISKIYRNLYTKIIRDPVAELDVQTRDCNTLLDIGCGTSSPVQFCSKRIYKVGVDAYIPAIKESKKKKIHNKYYHINVNDLRKTFKEKSFDCVIAYDLIEHLSKKDGKKLIMEMERIAKKKVIIFTPNGFLEQGPEFGNKFQIHLSGWSSKEMSKRGYRIIGMNGHKALRGKMTVIRYKPKFFWYIISEFSQIFVRYIPNKAFQILCVKNM